MQISFSSSQQASSDPNHAVRMVERWIATALDRRASDVHIQPRADRWDVSFRIDGVLQPAGTYERCSEFDPVSRLMALAGLPSYHGGIPQEGPLRWPSGDGKTREMRLGIFPTVHGNRAALRIMDESDEVRDLQNLGFDSETLQQLAAVCEAKNGWMLIAGPAGSGKTTTLYACLSQIATGAFHRSVLAIEDPIESVIDTISQSQVQHAGGMTLASAMRAAVRQDAEVLSVSEIRDTETAEAVLSASMTGHLCFSSIHAGSIGSTLRRLVQMKLPTYAIQSGLQWILCQRLLRKRCSACETESVSHPDSPCGQCHGTGYQGRIPVSQILSLGGTELGQSVFDAMLDGCPANRIDALISAAGIKSLREQADLLVQEGLTDANEVFRVMGQQT